MAVTYGAEVRDTHIAPGVSSFTSAEIPDMSDYTKESPHWVGNFFLNSTFRAKFKAPMDAYAYNFLRRAQFAFTEHDLARKATLGFLDGGSQSVTRYVEALFHWECFLGQAWHAYALLTTAWEGKAFQKNDGSVEQRLNAMYNQMKHVESRIENAQMLPGATVPVWLENQGLRSVDANLTFTETADVLKDLAKYANALMDPKTAKDILSAQDA
ncbi:MAG: hypothetical protein EPO47_07845 [Rugosibacter sp.]|nr:MAG: hypothetical protein EPO60_07235 [Rugosibacter sp.]TBR08788.1 MAG: hypothetical protein EPO47_07845 [Rugosibacter sp.]